MRRELWIETPEGLAQVCDADGMPVSPGSAYDLPRVALEVQEPGDGLHEPVGVTVARLRARVRELEREAVGLHEQLQVYEARERERHGQE